MKKSTIKPGTLGAFLKSVIERDKKDWRDHEERFMSLFRPKGLHIRSMLLTLRACARRMQGYTARWKNCQASFMMRLSHFKCSCIHSAGG